MKILNFFIALIVGLSTLLNLDLGYGRYPKKYKPVDLTGYELVWSDEFDGRELDRDKWNDAQNVDTLHWGAVRRGGYWHKDMVSVSDGCLHLAVRYVDEDRAALYGGDYKAGWYTAMITTWLSNPDNKEEPDEFFRGYYEVRCKLPAGEGLWSAFWLMNGRVYNEDGDGRDGTEIDVFESFGYPKGEWMMANAVSSNLHWDGYNDAHKSFHVGEFYANDPYKEFNTYGVKWTENEYIFYVNGMECARTAKGGVSQNPEYLILSNEIAGENGVASGRGDITTNADGVEFTVDYVRVYQAK